MNKQIINILPAIFLWLSSSGILTAQNAAQSDQITNDQQQIIQDKDTSNGKFPPVTVDAGSTTTVKLQFLTGSAGKTVLIRPLDGGTASADTATIDQNAVLTFSFSVGDQPGIYRVYVVDLNAQTPSKIVGVVQFVVPNPPA
jgi:hypothetical protein